MTELYKDEENSVFRIKNFYVYELYDKRTGDVFYVGEGVRERALDHIREAANIRKNLENESEKQPAHANAKIDRINDLISDGKDYLGIRVVGRFDSKHEAQAVEAILINWVYGPDNLTNISRGRGNLHIRPYDRSTCEIAGIDIPKRYDLQGRRSKRTGYLENIRNNHEKYLHFSMAEEIARHLDDAGVQLESNIPTYWEQGRYIALFVPLVTDSVRMIIQLTNSSKNQHVYNIIPTHNNNEGRRKFIIYMEKYHNEIYIRNNGMYCKLPGWEELRVRNDQWEVIIKQAQYAIDFFRREIAKTRDSDVSISRKK